MNKNDFEVWIFHYLLEHELQGKKKAQRKSTGDVFFVS